MHSAAKGKKAPDSTAAGPPQARTVALPDVARPCHPGERAGVECVLAWSDASVVKQDWGRGDAAGRYAPKVLAGDAPVCPEPRPTQPDPPLAWQRQDQHRIPACVTAPVATGR